MNRQELNAMLDSHYDRVEFVRWCRDERGVSDTSPEWYNLDWDQHSALIADSHPDWVVQWAALKTLRILAQ